MNRDLPKKNFQSQSVRDRNTSIGAKGLWECGSEPFKSFFMLYSRFRDGRELVEMTREVDVQNRLKLR